MTKMLTLKGLNKQGTEATYTGLNTVIKVPVANFVDKKAPAELIVEGDGFAEPKAPKVQETKEERKARLAALPKLTAEQKIAKLQEKLDKAKAKLAAPAPAAE